MFAPWTKHCFYLLLFAAERECIDHGDSFKRCNLRGLYEFVLTKQIGAAICGNAPDLDDCESFFLSSKIASSMRKESMAMLNAANVILARNLRNSAETYKACMRAIARTRDVQEFSQAILHEGGYSIEETEKSANDSMDALLKTYESFDQFNLVDAKGEVLVSSSRKGRPIKGMNIIRLVMAGMKHLKNKHFGISSGSIWLIFLGANLH